jgi:phosphate transport system permease protein
MLLKTRIPHMALATEGRPLEAALNKRLLKHPGELLILGFITLCALLTVVTTFAIVVTLVVESKPFFEEVSLREFLFTTNWQALQEPAHFGIWELVAGTVNVVLWSMVFALPLGLMAAIYLSEYARPRARRILKPLLEVLAGVPTVVYAFFALTFITQDVLRPLLGSDRVPFQNALGASLVLAVMILPTIASVSEDAMANVPRELREGAYGLGATRLEVALRVVLPAALPGVIASILLAISRVIGETMIVAVAAGSTPNLTLFPLESIQTMTGFMLQVAGGDVARGTTQYESLFAVGAALFVLTFALNIVATLIVQRFQEKYD